MSTENQQCSCYRYLQNGITTVLTENKIWRCASL